MFMEDIPLIFTPDPSEAVEMAEQVLHLEEAHQAFLKTEAECKSRTGILGSMAGKIGLRKALKEAQAQGLWVQDGHVLVPQVVSRAYFSTIEDDF